jgi:hypothetical protein
MSKPNTLRRHRRNIADILEGSVSNYEASDVFSEHSSGVDLPSITPPGSVAPSPSPSNAATRPAALSAASDPIPRAPPDLADLPPGLSLSDTRYADLHCSISLLR